MDDRRVVVTGMGATTPLGGDVASTWSSLLEGRSGARRFGEDDGWPPSLPVKIAAPVAVEPDRVLDRVRCRRLARTEQLALIAAREAWAQAGWEGATGEAGLDPERVGVSIATGVGGMLTTLRQYDTFRERGWQRVSPYTILQEMPNGPASTIGREFDARAGAHATVSACASGAEAIGYAVDMIRSGRADVVVAGGAEAAVHPFNIASFAAMRALSVRNDEPERASRPFDKGRDGFLLGEGSGAVILEAAEHARARGATVRAEAAGVGYSTDTHHMTHPDPTGGSAASTIRRALSDADTAPRDVVHINAHATSTPAGDLAEAAGIKAALGDAPQATVTATKSMTGHLLGGAGAVEAIATVLALEDGVAPATRNVDDLDDQVDVDVIRGEPRRLPDGPGAALNNSFGFGGHNVVTVFRRDRP